MFRLHAKLNEDEEAAKLYNRFIAQAELAEVCMCVCRPGGTGPVGQVLAGPTFRRGNSEIMTFTAIFTRGIPQLAIFTSSLYHSGCFCGGVAL